MDGSLDLDRFKELKGSLSDRDKVRLAVEETPEKFWGTLYGVQIIETTEEDSNYPTFLVIADTYKHNKPRRLIQSWYISNKGVATPMRNRSLFIPDDFSDELANALMDTHQLSKRK